jgi:hypothetical protein
VAKNVGLPVALLTAEPTKKRNADNDNSNESDTASEDDGVVAGGDFVLSKAYKRGPFPWFVVANIINQNMRVFCWVRLPNRALCRAAIHDNANILQCRKTKTYQP